ncbi:MAG: DUF5989 family protein [Candidatus Xenobia bacterium]
MAFIKEFLQFLGQNKKAWLVPTIVMLVLMAALVFFAEGSAIAPFIYTLF